MVERLAVDTPFFLLKYINGGKKKICRSKKILNQSHCKKAAED